MIEAGYSSNITIAVGAQPLGFGHPGVIHFHNLPALSQSIFCFNCSRVSFVVAVTTCSRRSEEHLRPPSASGGPDF